MIYFLGIKKVYKRANSVFRKMIILQDT